MSRTRHDKWAGTTYGNGWMHRALIGILRVTDTRVLYRFAGIFVVPVAMMAKGRERRAIYSLYRHRMGLGRIRAALMTYRNHCAFARVVIDRFAMYAGRRLSVVTEGLELFQELAAKPGAFMQLSSHTGNYEIAGYTMTTASKRLNALVFGGEKGSVMENRARMFRDHNVRMICTSDDMSHLFEVDAAIRAGEIISMPADRIFGSQKSFTIRFMGADARFPQGPFILAALRDIPVVFVTVMNTRPGAYTIKVHRLPTPAQGSVRDKAMALATQYVALLEQGLREHPEQWYNYFEFWDR